MKIAVMLEPEQAAALHRLCDKISHTDAMAYLYPHLPKELRTDQAYTMMDACSAVLQALDDQHVRSWPWIETGRS